MKKKERRDFTLKEKNNSIRVRAPPNKTIRNRIKHPLKKLTKLCFKNKRS